MIDDPALKAVVAAYDSVAPTDLQTKTTKRGHPQVLVEDWPKSLHYEFVDYGDQLGVELHLEHETVKRFAPLLSAFVGKEVLPGVALEWDPTYFGEKGKLLARTGKQNLERASQMMSALINMTRSAIDEELTTQRSQGR